MLSASAAPVELSIEAAARTRTRSGSTADAKTAMANQFPASSAQHGCSASKHRFFEERGKGGGSLRGALSLGEQQLKGAVPQGGVQHALKQDVGGVLHPAWLARCCAVDTLTLVVRAAGCTAQAVALLSGPVDASAQLRQALPPAALLHCRQV